MYKSHSPLTNCPKTSRNIVQVCKQTQSRTANNNLIGNAISMNLTIQVNRSIRWSTVQSVNNRIRLLPPAHRVFCFLNSYCPHASIHVNTRTWRTVELPLGFFYSHFHNEKGGNSSGRNARMRTDQSSVTCEMYAWWLLQHGWPSSALRWIVFNYLFYFDCRTL